MSLSSLIKDNPEIKKSFPMLKPYLEDLHCKKLGPLDWKMPIKVPSIGSSFESGLIGTAFDYVVRAMLAQRFEEKYVKLENHLIAEHGLNRFAELSKIKNLPLLFPTKDPAVNEERIKGFKVVYKNSKKILSYLREELNSSIEIRNRFIRGEKLLEELIQSSIFLARLDSAFRNGSMIVADDYFRKNSEPTYFSQNVTVSDNEMAENIYEMALSFIQIIEEECWRSTILNPNFGAFSLAVGGADADFIVDDILVDIKTKNQLKYDGNDFAQLFGYAAMARATGMEVNKVAIYYARFGCFAAIGLDNSIFGGDEFLSKFLSVIQDLKEK